MDLCRRSTGRSREVGLVAGRCKLRELFSVSLHMGRSLSEGLKHEVVEEDGRLLHLFLALCVELGLQSKR